MLTVLTQPGRRFMGRLNKGDDLLAALERLCQEHGIMLGEVRALGAVSRARVGFYNQEERKYYFLDFGQPLEILSLTGNVSLRDGKPMVHAHVTLADAAGRAVGGTWPRAPRSSPVSSSSLSTWRTRRSAGKTTRTRGSCSGRCCSCGGGGFPRLEARATGAGGPLPSPTAFFRPGSSR